MRRHKHALSHEVTFTGNMGMIYPCMCLEANPGDTIRHQQAAIVRFEPMLAPVMHKFNVQLHTWYAPYRNLWDGWEDLITGKVSETVNPIPTVKHADNAGGVSDLLDHLGVTPAAPDLEVVAFPVRAYNQIINEFYIDQQIQQPQPEDSLKLRRAAWEKDYFSVARLTAQQGDAVSIPFDVATAPVRTQNPTPQTYNSITSDANQELFVSGSATAGNEMEVDLSQATGGILLEDWRRSMALQRIKEHRNKYGERYTDYLRFLGLKPKDSRLDRPEFLGGGKQVVAISEVLSTTDSTEAPIGTLKGHGIQGIQTRPYRRFIPEHGVIISFFIIRPKAVYQQAVQRMFLRKTLYDYYQKEMEILGDQPVTKQEIFAPHPNATDVFGYVPRYDEYRRGFSYVAGAMRDSTANFWHVARDFGSTSPELNEAFIECNPQDERIFATTNIDSLKVRVHNRVSARRLISKRARP